jgi:SNF2 family DNA or RNA helicase
MDISKIPRITLKFDTIDYDGSSVKAYKCYLKGKLQWIPKSIATPVAGYRNSLNIAPFKFKDITGRVPQTIDTFVLQEVVDNKAFHNLPDYPYFTPHEIELKPKQREKVERIWRMRVFSINAEMRTGKTFMSATIINSRFRAGMIDKLVVVAPLRTKHVWTSMFERMDCPCEFIAVEHFSNIHTRDKIDVEINEKTFVAIDESHTIKNSDALRTQFIVKFFKKAQNKCTITGTPIGLHAGDLFWQWYFLDPFILGYETFEEMAKSHLLYGGNEGKKVVGYTNIEEISNKISPYTLLLTRKELGEERPETYAKIYYSISNRREYTEFGKLYHQYLTEFAKFKIMKMNTHLQQAARGFTFNENIEAVGYIDNGAIEKTKEIVGKRKGSTGVIYFKYNEEARALQKVFNAPTIWGENTQREFRKIIADFEAGTIPILLVQQRISQGFSLKNADYILYFSTIYDYIPRAQSQDRAKEGTKPLEIIDLIAHDTIDERIQDVISLKTDINSAVKDEIKKLGISEP